MTKNREFPVFIAQENDRFFIHLIFDHIPTYTFLIDDVEITPDDILYQKIELGHLIKIPVKENQTNFKVKTTVNTYLDKRIHLKEDPKKMMMLASFSSPIINSIAIENPDLLVVFTPPETQYYTHKDFLKNPIFYQSEIRPLVIVGSEHFKMMGHFPDFSISHLDQAHLIDRPTFLTHYLPFTYPRDEETFQTVASVLKRKELPVVFLSSFPRNLIQQIPKGQLGFPTYEFSVKNHFLALPNEEASPWEMITDQKSDYLTLEIDFIDSYWHILLQAKDETQNVVFSRDLTLYQTKPVDGRNRRNAR